MTEHSNTNKPKFHAEITALPIDVEKENQRAQIATTAPEDMGFYSIRKTHLLNGVTKISEKSRNTSTDLNGLSTITHNDISVKIDHQKAKKQITAATWQFLDFLLITHNESGASSREIRFTTEDFKAKRGLTNTQYANRVIKNNFDSLYEMSFSWRENARRGNKTISTAFDDVRVLTRKAGKEHIDGRGHYVAALTPEICEYFQTYGDKILDYPSFLLKIDTNKNEPAYYIGRKITEHKNVATIKEQDNADFLSVKTLLAACPCIPSYEEVKKTDRLYTRRIIAPFVKGLEGLEPHIQWNFAKKKHEPLTDEECEKIENDIDLFLASYIEITWTAYPDKMDAIDRRKKAIRKAEARHEKAKLNAETAIEKKKLEAAQAAKPENTSA